MPLSLIASSARRAEDALAYLQKTMPFEAIRSDLQYCRLLKRAISSCAVIDCLIRGNKVGLAVLQIAETCHIILRSDRLFNHT